MDFLNQAGGMSSLGDPFLSGGSSGGGASFGGVPFNQSPDDEGVYASLMNPNAISPYLQRVNTDNYNAATERENAVASAMPKAMLNSGMNDYTEVSVPEDYSSSLSISEGAGLAWNGLKTGIFATGPERMYRAIRAIGLFTGNDAIQEWAGRGVDENVRQRWEDPSLQADWSSISKWGGQSLYQGFEQFAASATIAVPGAAAGLAAPVAAKALGVSKGVAGGIALFSKAAAFLGAEGSTAAVAGLAEFDAFVDEATQLAQQYEPNITREDVMSDNFWEAALSGVAEAGIEFGQGVIIGKYAGILGKADAPVRHLLTQTIRNLSMNTITEIGGEAATAAIQDYAREIAGLNHQGRIEAAKAVIGPTLVASVLGGGLNTAMAQLQGGPSANTGIVPNPDEAAAALLGDMQARLEASRLDNTFSAEAQAVRAALLEEGAVLPESTVVPSMAPIERTEAFVSAAEGLARSAAMRSGVSVEDALNEIAQDMRTDPRFAEAVDALTNQEMNEDEVASHIAPYVAASLSEQDIGAFERNFTDYQSMGRAMLDMRRNKALPANLPSELEGPITRADGIVDDMIDGITPNQRVPLNTAFGESFGRPLQRRQAPSVMRKTTMVADLQARMRERLAEKGVPEGDVSNSTILDMNPEDVAASVDVNFFDRTAPKNGIEAFDAWQRALAPILPTLERNSLTLSDADVMAAADSTITELETTAAPLDTQPGWLNAARRGRRTRTGPNGMATDADMQARLDAQPVPGEAIPEGPAYGPARQMDYMKRSFERIYGMDKAAAVQERIINIVGEKIVQQARAVRLDNSLENQYTLMNLVEQRKAMQKVSQGVASEWGRLGRMIRVSRKNNRMADGIEQALDRFGGREMWEALPTLLENVETRQQQEEILNAYGKSSWWDVVSEYVTSGMLWGASTHIVNITSNAFNVTKTLAERAYASYTTDNQKGSVNSREVTEYLFGMWDGISQLKNIWTDHRNARGGTAAAVLDLKGLVDGVDTVDGMAESADMRQAISSENIGLLMNKSFPGLTSYMTQHHAALTDGLSTAVDYLGGAVRTPFLLLEGADKIFKVLTLRGEMRALARREAGSDDAAFTRLMQKPSNRIVEAAREHARVLTFQQDLGPLGQGINRIRNTVPWTRIFVPFLKTPLNVLAEGMAMTPGLNRLLGGFQAQLKSPDAAIRQMAEAKLMVGNMIWTTALSLASAGILTGPPPADRDLREKMLAAGVRFNAIKIGDSYYDISRLDPLAFILNSAAFIVNAEQYMEGETAAQAMLVGVGTAARLVTDRSYVRSLSDLIDLIQDPNRNVNTSLRRFGGMLVPASSLLRTFNRADPYMRDAQGFFDGIKSQIPGMAQTLPIRRDFLGKPIPSTQYAGNQYLSPFAFSEASSDPVYKEMARLAQAGESPSPMVRNFFTKNGQKIRLQPEEYDQFLEYFGSGARDQQTGETYKEWLDRTIQSPEYLERDDNGRVNMIKKKRDKYQKQTQEWYLENSNNGRRQLSKKAQGWQEVLPRTAATAARGVQ